MRTDSKPIFPFETVHTQNIKHAFQQNLYIPGCTSSTWDCMIQRKSSGFGFNSSGLMSKIELYRKNVIRQGKSIYSCHIRGEGEVSPSLGLYAVLIGYCWLAPLSNNRHSLYAQARFSLKFCFFVWSIRIACFHEHLAQKLRIGTLSEKVMQILNNDSPFALRAINHYEPLSLLVQQSGTNIYALK